MSVGDLVVYEFDIDKSYADVDDCQSSWGVGIVLSTRWDDSGFWESIVWFSEIDQHVLCDGTDLKKIA